MSVYYDYATSKNSPIDVAFEQYDHETDIEFHMHHFYEFTFIQRGFCIHRFRGVEVPLIAGDVFLVPPHEDHSYLIKPGTCIINCYFFPKRLEQYSTYMKDGAFKYSTISYSLVEVKHQWDALLSSISMREDIEESEPQKVTDNLSRQGILHLPPETAMEIESLLQLLYEECLHMQYDSEYMQVSLLQMILVIFKRARYNLPQQFAKPPEHKKQMIVRSMVYMEEHYAEPLRIQDLAEKSSLSESYYRRIFKEVTGMAPLDYLNHLRIVKALKFMQRDGLPIAEAAAKVGIYDSNYFTRLFKKVIGYPPRFFKKITSSED